MTQPPPRDPRQPFGARDARVPYGQPSAPIDPTTYQPPRNRAPWLVAGLAALVIAGLLLTLLFLQPGRTSPTPTATPTRPTAPVGSPSPASGDGIPWELPNGSAAGYWRVVGEHWEGSVVTLEIEVRCDRGMLTYEFLTYPNVGTTALDPEPSGPEPYLASGRVAAGDTARGNVSFRYAQRGPGTIILATAFDAVSGLKIKG